MPRLRRSLFVLLPFLSLFGGCLGGCIASRRSVVDGRATVYARLPHHVPPSPDSPAFRFAMVHDVIHERYAKHGPAYYEERERLARERMAGFHPESETAFALIDDIAVGLDRRGRSAEAIEMMRDKLRRQKSLGLEGKDIYSSQANLAEFLLHANLWGLLNKENESRDCVEEALYLIRTSMKENPKAHFGREEWQQVAIEGFLEFARNPGLLRTTDLIGNRIDSTIEISESERAYYYGDGSYFSFGRPYLSSWSASVVTHSNPEIPVDGEISDEIRTKVRSNIFQVGREIGTVNSKELIFGKRAPFDEPALWLIGEWRQGSGPSPHLALCLGEIMLRVGQRYLAWNCYERASRMAKDFWPEEYLQQFLITHCRERQQTLEDSMPTSTVSGLRTKFNSELEFGQRYQQEYQAYTQEKIQAGKNLNDPQFFDEFHANRPSIASDVGAEEWYAGNLLQFDLLKAGDSFLGWGLFIAGTLMLVGSGLLKWWSSASANSLSVREISPPEGHKPSQGVEPFGSNPADPS